MRGGYFRLPLATLGEVVRATDNADAVAAWIVLRRFAFGHSRELTAAGAKAVYSALGLPKRSGKRLLDSLLAIRFGDRGEGAVLMPADAWNAMHGQKVPTAKANAPVYVMPDPGGECAYLPDVLIPGKGSKSSLARICEWDAETAMDALRLLIHAHACVSCGDFLGADPSEFAYGQWAVEGAASSGNFDFELGLLGKYGGLHFWLVQEGDDTAPWAAVEAATGGRTDAHAERFWRVLRALCGEGFLYRAAIVSDGRGRLRYPLWIFGASHRERMERIGIRGRASEWLKIAKRQCWDQAQCLSESLAGEDGDKECGLFVVASDSAANPIVRTVYVPTLLAPTPDNMEGLAAVKGLCP